MCPRIAHIGGNTVDGDGCPALYVSYHDSDVMLALRLAATLRNAGICLWIDRLDTAPDEDRLIVRQNALDGCGAMIVVLSPQYLAARLCQREFMWARKAGLPIFVVISHAAPEANWPADLVGLPTVDFSAWQQPDGCAPCIEQLMDSLHEHAPFLSGPVPRSEERYLTTLLAETGARLETLAYLNSAFWADEAGGAVAYLRAWPDRWIAQAPFEVLAAGTGRETLTGIRAVARQHPRFVLIGPPNSGKTTVLYHLVLAAIWRRRTRRRAPLPLVVNMADWSDEEDLPAFLRRHWPFRSRPIKMLASGKAVLYLDGLSERRDVAAEKIRRLQDWLHGRHAPRRAVITCREEDYRGDYILGLPVVRVPRWSEQTVSAFATYARESDAAQVLLRILESEEGAETDAVRLSDLVERRPYLINAMIAAVENPRTPDVPRNVGALIGQLVAMRWRQYGSPEAAEAALSRLAFAMLRDDRPVIVPYMYAQDQVGSDQMIHAAHVGGFLQVVNGHVRFVHQPVQCFFAAKHLARGPIRDYLVPPRLTPDGERLPQKWDEAIVILACLATDPDQRVREIAGLDPYLALECILAGANVTVETRELIVSHLLETMHTDAQDGRVAGARLLAVAQPEAALSVLLEAMRDGRREVRWKATEALREIPMPVLPELAEALEELDRKRRDATASALRQLGEAALPTLLHLLRDENWFMRRGAAWALGEIGDAAAVPALIEALQDKEKLVCADAAIALGWIRDPEAIPWLRKLLHHSSRRVREAGATALSWIGGPAVRAMLEELRNGGRSLRQPVINALKSAHEHAVRDELLKATYDEDVEVRSAAVEALENVEGDVFIIRMIELLADTARSRWQNSRICDIAAGILKKSGRADARSAVQRWEEGGSVHPAHVQRSSTPPPDSSAAVARHRLAGITQAALPPAESEPQGSPATPDIAEAMSALPRLLKALQDPDVEVRVAAVETLGTFHTEEAWRGLIWALADNDYPVYEAAAEALTRLGAEAVPYLTRALRSTNTNLRGGAIRVLERIGDPASVPALAACLSDTECPRTGSQRICDLAARALEAIGTPEAQHAVQQWRAVGILTQPVEHHSAAAPSNGETELQAPQPESRQGQPETDDRGSRKILMELLTNLHHSDWAVRQDSAQALREYAKLLHGTQDTTVLEQLLTALEDSDWAIRWAVVEALAWIGNPAAVPPLIEQLDDPNWTVRVAVIRALMEIGDLRAVTGIAKMLADPKDLVREAAAEALGELGDPAAAAALVNAVSDPEEFVRLAALRAIGKLGYENAVPTLINALDDSSSHIRWMAATALENIASEAAVPALIASLEDYDGPYWEDSKVCDVAARALERIGTPQALDAVAQWRRSQQEESLP